MFDTILHKVVLDHYHYLPMLLPICLNHATTDPVEAGDASEEALVPASHSVDDQSYTETKNATQFEVA